MKIVFPKAVYFIQGVVKMSSNRQNYQSDIPKGRSTSRIKNASKSQGFANKDLYGSSAHTGTVNGQFYKAQNINHNYKRQMVNNARNNENRTANRNSAQKNRGEMSESTIVKVIAGSILAAVILAIIIIIALSFMDFQI